MICISHAASYWLLNINKIIQNVYVSLSIYICLAKRRKIRERVRDRGKKTRKRETNKEREEFARKNGKK